MTVLRMRGKLLLKPLDKQAFERGKKNQKGISERLSESPPEIHATESEPVSNHKHICNEVGNEPRPKSHSRANAVVKRTKTIMTDKMAPVAYLSLHLSSFSFIEFYQRFGSITPAENP